MQRWRADEATADKARACEARRVVDDRRRAERKARTYVLTYLSRGRIVPPTRCDACGARSDELQFFHPDPNAVRLLVWLCPNDRRVVRAARRPVIPHWEWPGHVEPPPTRPRWPRFALAEVWQEAGNIALARVAAHLRSESEKADVFMSAFLRAAGDTERHNLIGHGLGLLRGLDDRARAAAALFAWVPYGIADVDAFVRRFVLDTKARFARARAEAEPRFLADDEDYIASRGVVPVFDPRPRRRRHDSRRSIEPDAIGDVPAAPPQRPYVPPAGQRPQTLNDAFLARLDSLEAEHDARIAEIMARVAARPKRNEATTRELEEGPRPPD
jgi:hypothetical protein